jgi:transcriptional regulator with XRE-family HTH domain
MSIEHTEVAQEVATDPNTPGTMMEARRKELGIKTVAELGRRANLSRQYLTAVKKDRFTPKLDKAMQLSRALEMDVLTLFPTLEGKVRIAAPAPDAPVTETTGG